MTSDEDAVDIGRRIRQLRVAQGLSQEELAAPEFSASYLSRIESGARPAGGQLLAQLATRLGTTAEHLVTGVDPAASRSLELTVRYAELALRSGEPSDALAQFGEALQAAATLDHSELRRRALLGRAQACEATGDLESALDGFHEVEVASIVGSSSWVDSSLGLVRCYRQIGDLTKSAELGERLVAEMRQQASWPTPDGVRLLCTLQATYHERGDLHYAARIAEEALALADGLADRRAQASALWESSLLNAALGAVSDAVLSAERALALMAEVSAERDTARLKVALARLYNRDGRPREALDLLDAAAAGQAEVNVASDTAFWMHERARSLLALGELDAAEEAARGALDAIGDKPRLNAADVAITLGRIERSRGSKGAAQWLRRAAQALVAVGSDRAAAAIWAELGGELDAADQTSDARDAYRAAAICAGLAVPAHTAGNLVVAKPSP